MASVSQPGLRIRLVFEKLRLDGQPGRTPSGIPASRASIPWYGPRPRTCSCGLLRVDPFQSVEPRVSPPESLSVAIGHKVAVVAGASERPHESRLQLVPRKAHCSGVQVLEPSRRRQRASMDVAIVTGETPGSGAGSPALTPTTDRTTRDLEVEVEVLVRLVPPLELALGLRAGAYPAPARRGPRGAPEAYGRNTSCFLEGFRPSGVLNPNRSEVRVPGA